MNFVGKVIAYIYNGINSCEASFLPNSDMLPFILAYCFRLVLSQHRINFS